MTAHSTRRLAAAGAVAVAGALLLTACGDQTKGGNSGGGQAKGSEAPLFDKLPQSVRDKGEIKVGSDIAYAPVEFKDSSG
ncbi:ABC transporter substrate-binding protein, partial [Streptomyces sp. NPDC002523]